MPKHQEYRGTQRNRRVTVDSPLVPTHTCSSCGKLAYVSRKDAKSMAKKLHQDGRYRLYQCRGGNTSDSWHVTTMGAWATMRYKDWEANGYQPYEAMNDFPPLEGA